MHFLAKIALSSRTRFQNTIEGFESIRSELFKTHSFQKLSLIGTILNKMLCARDSEGLQEGRHPRD